MEAITAGEIVKAVDGTLLAGNPETVIVIYALTAGK